MNQVMSKLEKMQESEYSSVVHVLFGLSSPTAVSADSYSTEWIDPTLNDSQKEAIKFALGSREVALIHGPPGVRFHRHERYESTDPCIDRQNTHSYRAYPPISQAEAAYLGMRSIQHFC